MLQEQLGGFYHIALKDMKMNESYSSINLKYIRPTYDCLWKAISS